MRKLSTTFAKKSMSVLLAVLMLLTSWVWVAPTDASAKISDDNAAKLKTLTGTTDITANAKASFPHDSAGNDGSKAFVNVLYTPNYTNSNRFSGVVNISVTYDKNWAGNRSTAVISYHYSPAVLMYDGATTPSTGVLMTHDGNKSGGTSTFSSITNGSWLENTDGLVINEFWRGQCGGNMDFAWAINQGYAADYRPGKYEYHFTTDSKSSSEPSTANKIKFTGSMDDNTYSKTLYPIFHYYGSGSSGGERNEKATGTQPIYIVNVKPLKKAYTEALEVYNKINDNPGKYTAASVAEYVKLAQALLDANPNKYDWKSNTGDQVAQYAADAKAAVNAWNSWGGLVEATYTIKWVSDGKTVRTDTKKYNETVTAPTVSKAADADNHYNFIGWSPAVETKATEDVTYTAQYETVAHTIKEENRNVVEPTCTATGSYTKVVYCTVCNHILSSVDGTFPTNPHNYTAERAEAKYLKSEATCNKPAVYYKSCVDCGATGASTFEYGSVDSSKHVIVPIAETDSLCNFQGIKAHYTCNVCTALFWDQAGNNPITNPDDIYKPLGDHKSMIVPGYPATCTATGLTDETVCSVCGTILKAAETIPVIPHNDADKDHLCDSCYAEMGTCEDADKDHYCDYGCGLYYGFCEDFDGDGDHLCDYGCGKVLNDCVAGEAVKENIKAETCETAGSYDEVTYCTECKKELSRKNIVVPAKQHAWSDAEYTWSEDGASCTVTRVCGNDGTHKETETVNTTSKVIAEATCKENGKTGYTADFTVAWAEDQYIEINDIPSKPHTPGEEVVENSKEATCAAEGSYDKVIYCTACGGVVSRETVTISKLPHTEGEVKVENNVAPTCQKTGSYDKVVRCTECNEVISRETVTVPVIDHIGGSVVIENETVATCEHPGYHEKVVYCTMCKAELSREKVNVPKQDHTSNGFEVENRVESTCTVAGSYDKVEYCKYCGIQISREKVTLELAKHTKGEVVVENNVAPTCKAEGSYDNVVYCTVCNTVISRVTVTVDKLPHKYSEAKIENEVDATCYAEGSYDEVIYCADCGEKLFTKTVYIEKIAHTPAEPVRIDVATATCTKGGRYESVVYCSVEECKAELSRDYIKTEALGHEEVVSKAVAPTCTTTGLTEGRKCSRCDVVFAAQKVVPALGHDWDDGVITGGSSCTADGVKTFTCKTCGETKTEVISADGHTPAAAVKEHNVDPACETDGSYDTVVYCSVCKAEISRKTTVVPKLGHKKGAAVKEHEIEATCTTAGSYEMVSYCSVCNLEITRNTSEIPALGHTKEAPVIENKVDATCDIDGSYDKVVYCSVCKGEVSRENKAILATGHKYTSVVTQPTCNTNGYTTYTCTVCNASHVTDTVAPLGHTRGPVQVENKVESTCSAAGSYENVIYCTVCKEELSRTKIKIDALDHTPTSPVRENEKISDCDVDGSYDEVIYCSVCSKELSRTQKLLPASGHTAGEAKIENEVAADCDTEGSYDTVVRCTVCGDIISKDVTVIPALGHKAGEAVKENEVAGDCVKKGSYDLVKYCTVCKAEVSRETIVVSGFGHKAGDEVIENKVTGNCTTDSSYDTVVYCTECKTELSRKTTTTPAPGHNVVTLAAKAPTCDEPGLTEGKHCSRCGEVFAQQTEIPATGHKFPAEPTKVLAPNCISAVTYVYKCNNCDFEKIETSGEPDPNAPHGKKVLGSVEAATCDKAGLETYICELCKETLDVVTIPALGHIDKDGDGICDGPDCDEVLKEPDTGDDDNTGGNGGNSGDNDDNDDNNNGACGCICHKTNPFMKFLYKIVRFFWNLFGIGKSCDCGAVHY